MRYFAAVMAVLLSLLMLTACGTEPPSTVEGEETTPTQSGSEQELQALFDDIALIPVGTMGVSLKFSEVTAMLMDWCEATAMTPEQILEKLNAYYEGAADPMVFIDQVDGIAGCVNSFKDPATREAMLADAGLGAKNYTWTDKAFENAAVFGSVVDMWLNRGVVGGTEPCFQATVKEVYPQSLLVTPLEGESELLSADQISVTLPDPSLAVQVGNIVLIEYDGMIAESYPAQITAHTVTVVG